MTSRHRAAAIHLALTRIELDVDARGWDALPTLLGLFDATADRDNLRIDIDELGVDAALWRMHQQTVPGMLVPYWVGLKALTDHFTAPDAPPRLAQWAQSGPQRLVGLAFLGEGLDTSDSGRRVAVAHGVPDEPDGIPVRALTACDIDGRHYQILRIRGTAITTTVTLDDPPSSVRASCIPASLHRLLTAARA